MIERAILSQLMDWKAKTDRKPLLLFGARQVGKTWVLKHFGQTAFKYCAYFSLDEENGIADIFRRTKAPKSIIEQLSFLCDVPIVAHDTLLILDEIQECPEALTSLKYFCEQAPEFAVACAGSLLGITIGHEGFSFPVGKVNHLDMFPLSFAEFLKAKDQSLYKYFMSVNEFLPLPQIFFDRLTEAFSAYRICGGMPEVTAAMLRDGIMTAEEKLNNILKDYSLDFVKHATPVLANKIAYVWSSLPSQLAKENRKFIYQLVRPGARAREYEDALIWLERAGLIYKVNHCHEPQLPLKAYEDINIFKVYANDIGLLRRLSDVSPEVYMAPSDHFREFKGALAENYVMQSLVMQFGKNLRYWSSGNMAEVEFIIQHGTSVIPIEVKAGTSVTGKSLVQYEKNYAPEYRLRFSMRNLRKDGNLINIPLFMADRAKELLARE